MVCDGTLSLAAAQQAIATNWYTAYQTYTGNPASTPTSGTGTLTCSASTSERPLTTQPSTSSSTPASPGSRSLLPPTTRPPTPPAAQAKLSILVHGREAFDLDDKEGVVLDP